MRAADPGIDLLDPRVRPGIRTAARLYGEILDRIVEHFWSAVEKHP